MTTTKPKGLRLSVEELAFAIGAIGEAETAGAFLRVLLGTRCREEIDGRLLSASHSLIARGYLTFDLSEKERELDKQLAELVGVLAGCDFSIRCGRSVQDGEDVHSYFFKGDAIVEHRLSMDVVSELEHLPSADIAMKRSLVFFGLGEADSRKKTDEIGVLPADLAG